MSSLVDLDRQIRELQSQLGKLRTELNAVKQAGSGISTSGQSWAANINLISLKKIISWGFEWVNEQVRVKAASNSGIAVSSSGVGTVRKSGGGILCDSSGLYLSIYVKNRYGFTCDNSNSTTVNDTNVTAASAIILFPINAAAANLQASAKSLYEDIASRVVGTSFTVNTADGNPALGTEEFEYIITN